MIAGRSITAWIFIVPPQRGQSSGSSSKTWRIRHVVLLVSCRCGFEIAQKAIVAGVPVVGSESAPSSLTAQLARELDLTLVGFLRGRRFVIYSGEERPSLEDGAP